MRWFLAVVIVATLGIVTPAHALQWAVVADGSPPETEQVVRAASSKAIRAFERHTGHAWHRYRTRCHKREDAVAWRCRTRVSGGTYVGTFRMRVRMVDGHAVARIRDFAIIA